MKLPQRWEQTTLANKLMVITTAIVAFGTVFYVVVAAFQWKLMKTSGEQTSLQIDRLIVEARHVADTSAENTRQSKAALDATIENFHLEQRAWVGPTIVSYPTHIVNGNKVYVKEGEKFATVIAVKNSGKTPARDVRTVTTVFFEKTGTILKQLVPINVKDLQGVGILQPGANLELNAVFPTNGGVISKNDIEEITRGKAVISIVSEISYEDVFKKSHFTKFCFQLSPDLAVFHGCNKGNDAN